MGWDRLQYGSFNKFEFISFSSVGWFYTASLAGLDNLTLYGPANAALYYKKYTIRYNLNLKPVSRLFYKSVIKIM